MNRLSWCLACLVVTIAACAEGDEDEGAGSDSTSGTQMVGEPCGDVDRACEEDLVCIQGVNDTGLVCKERCEVGGDPCPDNLVCRPLAEPDGVGACDEVEDV